VGAIEPQFRAALLEGLGLGMTPTREEMAAAIGGRTRDEWVALFAGKDACVAPVLGLGEAPDHPHNRARGTFIDLNGAVQPGPAPRYSGTMVEQPTSPRPEGADGKAILAELGYPEGAISDLKDKGVLL
jgi:alpha-methylacyl-CoA racemase